MKRRPIIVAMVLAMSARAAADPIYHLKTPSTLKTDGGSELRLPPGYFLDEQTWQERDLELKVAQEARTRLKAENASLRKSAADGPSVTFWTVTFAVGALTGFVGLQMLK